MKNLTNMYLQSIDEDIAIVNKTLNRLTKDGWTKGNYVVGDGACCLIGAMDDWSYGGSDSNSDFSKVKPMSTENVKLSMAKLIMNDYYFIYDDFRPIVEAGYTIHSDAFMDDLAWAEATIFQFNDHQDVEFDDIVKLLNKVIAYYED